MARFPSVPLGTRPSPGDLASTPAVDQKCWFAVSANRPALATQAGDTAYAQLWLPSLSLWGQMPVRNQGPGLHQAQHQCRAVPCARLARVSPLLVTKRMAWMTAFGVVLEFRAVLYLDAPMEPQMHKPYRL